MRVLSGNKVFSKKTKVSEDLNLSNSLTPLLYLPDLQPGVTYTLDILDPLSLDTHKAKITVTGMESYEYGGKPIDTYVVETQYQGISFTSWVTESGEVLKEATPLGWTLLREDRDVAVDFRAADFGSRRDIAKLVAVPSDVQISEPELTRELEAYVTGIDLDRFQLDGAGQRLVDAQTGLIRIEMKSPQATRNVPVHTTNESLAEFLVPTLFVQSDDDDIRDLAAEIAGDETYSLRMAERINQWLFENIRKKITFSLPSVVEVLETREGDCNEHTVLFVALARSLNIPSRLAIGLVYHKGHFYYHAWPEVYVGEWVGLDAKWLAVYKRSGEYYTDATHIKLGDSALDEGIFQEMGQAMSEVIGNMKLDILEYIEDK